MEGILASPLSDVRACMKVISMCLSRSGPNGLYLTLIGKFVTISLQSTSRMTTPTTVTIQIGRFHDCEGCIRRAKKEICKLDGVELSEMDPARGKFTILTTKHPDEIYHALKRKFPTKDIICSPDVNRSYPLHVAPDVDDHFAKALEAISQVKGLGSIEYTQSNTFKFNFTNQPPPPLPSPPLPSPPQTDIEPSAPPRPTTPDLGGYVYGYPPEFYGFENHPHAFCTIL